MEKAFEQYLEEIRKICKEEGYDSLDETFVKHLWARFMKEPVWIGEGKRIRLRELALSDLDTLYSFYDAGKETVLEAFIRDSYEESKEYLRSYIGQMYPMYDYGMWAAEEKLTGQMIGLCGLGQAQINGEGYTDLGYYICPEKRNQGLATEAVELVLDYAKNYLEFPAIYAIIKEENRISAGLLRKFGFVPVGAWDGQQILRSSNEQDENHLLCK